MPDRKELEKLGIQNWSQLSKQFEKSNLLLGNGFSLNIAPDSFRYESLFDKFLNNCPPGYADQFRKFKTHNFERILEKLINAKEVNLIFGSHLSQIEEAIELLKVGLITTIQDIHPRAEEIYWGTLEKTATQLRFFKDIFTLNYDLFLYHIVMIMKDQYDKNHNLSRYSDCFWQEHDQDFNRFNSLQDYLRFRFVYYLHGALFLFRESLIDLKLLRKPSDETELVERVGKAIEEGRMPLFVCEGTSAEKQETIGTSNYLEFALRKLRFSKENLVIFGTSLSKQDQHIIDAIDYIHKTNHRTKDLAISVRISTKSRETLEREIDETQNKFCNCNIYLFDSETFVDFLGISKKDKSQVDVTTEISMLDRVKKHWPEIVASMRGEGKQGNLDALLRSTCEPTMFDGGVLTVGFYHKFHLEYMQQYNYQKLLEGKISEILKMPIKIQYKLKSKLVKDE